MGFDADAFWLGLYDRLQKRSLDETWCYWLVGLFEGEGSFTYVRMNRGASITPQFFMDMQHDTVLMQEVHQITGIGSLYFIKPKAPRRDGGEYAPRMSWFVRTKPSLQALVTFLEKYRLRSKKAQEYALWSQMVAEYVTVGGKSPRLRELALALSDTNQKISGHTLTARAKLRGRNTA